MDKNRKEGIALMAASFLLALAVIFMSEGWYVDRSFFWSLTNTMTLYDGYPFGCKEAATEPLWLNQIKQDCNSSFHLVMPTRYFILLLTSLFIYGLAVVMLIAPTITSILIRVLGGGRKN